MEQTIEIVNNWNLRKMMSELENGNILIPRFQREYSWEMSKVVSLLNSIYSQYPIGSFFLWIAPKEFKNFIRNHEELGIVQNTDHSHYVFILDGQQRILSLYLCLKGKKFENTDYSKLCFNLEKKQFVYPRKQGLKLNIEAWKIFDDIEYNETYAELLMSDRSDKTRFAATWAHCRDVFNNYPLSIVKNLHKDIDDVVEIFERINQGGKRLTIYDLIQASTWSEKFDLNQRIAEFNSHPYVKRLGGLSNRIFTQSLAINAFGDCKNASQLKLSPNICQKLWPSTKQSLSKTMDFFKSLRIHNDLALYEVFVPVLQYYFYKAEKLAVSDGQTKTLEKWFWDSKFSKRYNTQTVSKMKEDLTWIDSLFETRK